MTCARTVSRFSLSMLARCGGREDVAVHRDDGLGRQCLRPLNVTYASGQPPVLEDDTRIEALLIGDGSLPLSFRSKAQQIGASPAPANPWCDPGTCCVPS